VNLDPYWDYLENVARERLQNNVTVRHVSEYGPGIEIMGAAGELAARLYLGLPPSLHTQFDAGADLRWRGWTVDVKSTRLTLTIAHKFLQFPSWKTVRADIVMMVAVDVDRQDAVPLGWATKQMVNNAKVNETRKVECREIPVPNLLPMWALFTINPLDHSLRRSEFQIQT